ncbi:hypothetical protein [Lactobacillus psittaci]|uniref:hypothetical protein n=1 Tax=Lactobacillus psittaci TaxID=116089 RepID=UPI0003FC2519|nr:hypothetical protein [Lactobacillus psittaci]
MGLIEFLILLLVVLVVGIILFAILKMLFWIAPFVIIIALLGWLYFYLAKKKLNKFINIQFDNFKNEFDDEQPNKEKHRKQARNVHTHDVDDK